MKRGKFESQPVAKKNNGKKIVSMLLVLVLLLGAVVGTTLAWLKDTTATINNTFTVGSISITLEESYDTFKMTPGAEIDKDPVVTVKADSEACWLFIEIVEKNNTNDQIIYDVVTDWQEVTPGSGVYYQKVSSKNVDQEFHVLVGDKVKANENLTKEYLDDVKEGDTLAPVLSFTAYAIQSEDLTKDDAEVTDPAVAWNLVSGK